MPEDDDDCAVRWALIKSGFSRGIPKQEWISAARRRKHERSLWQRRFWEHVIYDEVDLQRHMDYIHINPVKHGYVTCASEWPYNSIYRYIRQGWMIPDWAAGADDGFLVEER